MEGCTITVIMRKAFEFSSPRWKAALILFALTVLVAMCGARSHSTSAVNFPYAGLRAVLICGADKDGSVCFQADLPEIESTSRFLRAQGFDVSIVKAPTTWAVLRPKMEGASIVGYWGHGVIHGSAEEAQTYDVHGFWIGDFVSGDQIESQIHFAPGAIIMLFHASWASGNSDDDAGKVPSSMARMRVSNYSQAFLRAGANLFYAGWGQDFLKSYLAGKSAQESMIPASNTAQVLKWTNAFVPDSSIVVLASQKKGLNFPNHGPALGGDLSSTGGKLAIEAAKTRQAKNVWRTRLNVDPAISVDQASFVGAAYASLPTRIADHSHGMITVCESAEPPDVDFRVTTAEVTRIETKQQPTGSWIANVALSKDDLNGLLSGQDVGIFEQAWAQVLKAHLHGLGYDVDHVDAADNWVYSYRPTSAEAAVRPLVVSPTESAKVGSRFDVKLSGPHTDAMHVSAIDSKGHPLPVEGSGDLYSVTTTGVPVGDSIKILVKPSDGGPATVRDVVVTPFQAPLLHDAVLANVSVSAKGDFVDVTFLAETDEKVGPLLRIHYADGGEMTVGMRLTKTEGSSQSFVGSVYVGPNHVNRVVQHSIEVVVKSEIGLFQTPAVTLLQDPGVAEQLRTESASRGAGH
jgi:hypothetical protein